MNRKIAAVIIELIPVLSAPLSYLLIISKYDSPLIRTFILVTFACAFLGFAAFFIGRRIGKEYRIVRILSILDLLATFYVVGLYFLAILMLGR